MTASIPTFRKTIARLTRRLRKRAPTPPRAAAMREYATPLHRATAPFHVVLKLSIPELPARQAVYGEHVGRTVVALSPQAVVESSDLGRSWLSRETRIEPGPRACFTTSRGTHLVCTNPAPEAPHGAKLYRFDTAWRQIGAPRDIASPWHGSASIGEARGTLMFAEYPDNVAKYRGDGGPVSSAKVRRSRDDGASWQTVKEVGPDAIRHLHTLVPEPGVPGRWWLSSGDRAGEVFVWRSDDDGDSWTDVTEDAPDVTLHPHFARHARAVQRMTDLVFHDGWMIWGADDWLGLNPQNRDDRPAPGSRIFRARTDGPWKVEALGLCGKPVRNIVDVGPAFLLTTEAKHVDRGARPDVFLLFKDDLATVHHIAQIDNHARGGTGFTFSFASRAATDGVFFSHRATGDVFPSDTRMLRWELIFS
ncbi:MAG TPA: sialidase family protein [Rhizomicrobium sp.]|nr:sialidase family protein [Rhizomicrobium sp.]